MWAYQTEVEELHGEVGRRAGVLLPTQDGPKAGQTGDMKVEHGRALGAGNVRETQRRRLPRLANESGFIGKCLKGAGLAGPRKLPEVRSRGRAWP